MCQKELKHRKKIEQKIEKAEEEGGIEKIVKKLQEIYSKIKKI